MSAGLLACSFCATVPTESWLPDLGVALVVLLLVGVVVAVGATMTWGRRAAALWVVAAALVLVLPASVVLAGVSSEIDGVVGPPPPDSPDGTWRVRCVGAFPEQRENRLAALSDACRDATAVRRTAATGLAAVGALMVVGGLAAAVPRPPKRPHAEPNRVEPGTAGPEHALTSEP